MNWRDLWADLYYEDEPEDDSPEIEFGETAIRRFTSQHRYAYRCFDPG